MCASSFAGTGVLGLTFPGCPATYQKQFRHFGLEGGSQRQGKKLRDENQKIHQFRKGDVVALPSGVPHWFYNEGDTPVVALFVFDVNNNANQLEPRQKVLLSKLISNLASRCYVFYPLLICIKFNMLNNLFCAKI